AFVSRDQRALAAAFGGVTEQVQRRAAQEAQLRQYAERGERPRAVLALEQAAFGILLRQQRWGQVEVEFVIALELLFQAPAEFAAGVQARDFVLVLVCHQLEQIAGGG